jgi:hypothetical protein
VDKHPLTLERLDDVSLALFSNVATPTVGPADHLIPLVEWEWLRAAGHRMEPVRCSPIFQLMLSAVAKRRPFWLDSPNDLKAGFVRVWRKWDDTEDATWIAFLEAFTRGAQQCGLYKSTVEQIAGAMKELEDNVHDHSGKARSGMIAFAMRPGSLEFVVVDRGMGVLASLRRSGDMAAVSDHGAALQAAVRSGASRYGTGSGYGQGFNRMILGLADTRALVRFRSGDSLLELDGRSEGSMPARLVPKAFGNGFLVAAEVRFD